MRLAKLYAFLYRRYYWKNMYQDIKAILDQCEICNRINSKIDYRHLRPIKAKYLFQLILLDMGHILSNSHDHYFIIAIDHFTRWIEVK